VSYDLCFEPTFLKFQVAQQLLSLNFDMVSLESIQISNYEVVAAVNNFKILGKEMVSLWILPHPKVSSTSYL